MRRVALLALSLAFAADLPAQQVADSAFTFPNPDPIHEAGAGPTVCVDAAHHNFHTLGGRYYAFGKLLRGDGFRTVSWAEPFTESGLAGCDVMVIANALGEANAEDWEFPHPSAFTGEEIFALLSWIDDGGGLLLVMDHAPMPGVVSDLASLVGAVPLDGRGSYGLFGELQQDALEGASVVDELPVEELRRQLGTPGSLGDHPILRGRPGVDAPVRTVMTFGGTAFLPSETMTPLLRPAPGAEGMVYTGSLPQERWPRYSLDGWLVGAAREYGEGRVAVFGEAATCTAQRAGPDGWPMGMNHPLSVDNPRYCLNTVRWLARVL